MESLGCFVLEDIIVVEVMPIRQLALVVLIQISQGAVNVALVQKAFIVIWLQLIQIFVQRDIGVLRELIIQLNTLAHLEPSPI